MMKKIRLTGLALAAVVMLFITGYGCSSAKTATTVAGQVSLQGTWKLVMFKYGSSASSFTEVPAASQRLKMITDNYFIWVSVDSVKRAIGSSAGGRYILEGNNYTEMLDFGLGMSSYTGTNPTYTVKTEDDLLFLSGLLSPGYRIEEIWKRVK